MKKTLKAKKGDISECLDFIHEIIDGQKLDKSEKNRALLAAEEALVKLDQATPEGKSIHITITRRYGRTNLTMTARGDEFDLYANEFFEDMTAAKVDLEDMTAGTEEEIRSLLLRSFEDKISYSANKGVNKIRISIAKSRYQSLFRTLTGMVAGLLFGVLFSAILPEAANSWINDNVLNTITTIFMNMLKIVIGPVVFFSIATSVSGFGNMSELGRVGAKTLGFYTLTSVIAISIGVAIHTLIPTGDPNLATQITEDVSQITDAAGQTSTSVLDTLINIVPNNLFRPFLEADMLQVIFLAVICGLAVSILGKRTQLLSNLFDNCNELFMKITTMFMKLIPLATFCSMCSMVLTTGARSFISVLSIVGGFLLCVMIMICVYLVLLLVFARVNPFRVMKKYFPTMVQVFSICSSNAAIPINMNSCRNDLGIHPRIYSLTIPLGATLNMDGCNIALSFFGLSFCHIFGIPVTMDLLLPLVLMILLLSMGAPGIPNSGLILLTMVLAQIHVPVAAISLVMGIWPIEDMFGTANNCLGDVVGTFVVAKSEGLVDMEVFNN